MPDKLRVVMTSAALALSLSGTGLTQTLVEEMGATQIGSTLQQSGMPVLGRITAPAAQPSAAQPSPVQSSPIQPSAAGVSTPPQTPAQGTPSAGAAPLLPVSRPTPAYLSALDAARRSLQAGSPRQARQQYERLVAQDYQNPQAHFGLGLALFGLGDLQGARFEFGQLISLDPAGFEGPYNLGVIASRQGQSAEALIQFGKAAELARGKVSVPVLRQVLEALASEQARRGDYAALSLTLASLTANQPDDLGLRFRQAQALRLSGHGTDALPLLYGVRQQQPGQVDAALLTADIYAGQGLYGRGIRELDAALGAVKDGPSRSRLLLRRSDLLVLAGRTHDAVFAAQAAVGADAGSAPAQARLGELRVSRGDARGALAAWSAAVSLTPASAAYRANLATVKLSLGQLAAAVGDARATVR
ncbi:MAG: tetratricopeptide repeat protein, partial [Deinococcus sp.]